MSTTTKIEALLSAARPDEAKVNTKFTNAVMNSIENPEIFSAHVRSMNVTKQETFMTKLKHLPKLAIVALALGALLLLSGTAYATYQLFWSKPSVELTQLTTSTSGRQEAVLSTKQCGPADAQRYELKNGATITADRIPAIVQAQCELTAINTWANSVYEKNPTSEPKVGVPYEIRSVVVSMATRLQAKQNGSLTFAGSEQLGIPEETFKVSKDVTYIVDGAKTTADKIAVGDTVAYVGTRTYSVTRGGASTSSEEVEQKLVAVVKLAMPFEDYDQFAWQSLSERQTCYGNPTESCLAGGASIDLYMGGADAKGADMKEIQGVVTALNGKTTSIRASSGTIYTITTPTDAIGSYNKNKADQYYNGQKVGIGSSISARYTEPENEHATNVTAFEMQFLIELIRKSDAVKAY